MRILARQHTSGSGNEVAHSGVIGDDKSQQGNDDRVVGGLPVSARSTISERPFAFTCVYIPSGISSTGKQDNSHHTQDLEIPPLGGLVP